MKTPCIPDGNFGGIAGIAEMLLQSHTDELVFLPALPDFWKEGSVKGLLARGGLEVPMKWQNSQIEKIELVTIASSTFRLRFPDNHALKQIIVNGSRQAIDSPDILEIALQKGDRVQIHN